ncbi:MAG TPA: thioesterase domain-containing protein [Streptosporangiaceae bacterium]
MPPEATSARPLTPARDGIELQICDLWRQVLGTPEIGVHDDFFESGGHSLLAIKIVVGIRRLFGIDVTAGELLEANTIAKLAEIVRRGGDGAASPLIRLRAGDAALAPVYGLPPVSGTVLVYVRVMQNLGGDRPFWALQSVGLQPGERPLGTVHEIAADFVDRARAVHPAGRPWHLLGYSMGGVLAFEVARQLREAGEPVGLVGLFDTRPTADTDGDDDYALRALLSRALRLDLDLATVRSLGPDERARLLLKHAVAAGTVPADFDADRLRRMVDMYQHNLDAITTYDPRGYRGKLTLYRVTDRSLESVELPRDLDWTRRADAIEIFDVPGNHFTMIEPGNVEKLAALIETAIS